MNNKKARSSLKKVSKLPDEEADHVRTKRRISFSGKKFIREFDTTEKARDYDNSYEISDHTNGEDSSGHSHGTVAASVLQSTAHLYVADETDKENASPEGLIAAVNSASVLEQNSRFSDFTFKLQTSINVTLLPDELNRNRRRNESPPRLEQTVSDSLSLNEIEREKLRENSVYKMTVLEKTVDLMPETLAYAGLQPNHIEKVNMQKTTIMSTDISVLPEKQTEVKQKTMVFENKDITCDFSDIEPKGMIEDVPKATQETQENLSMDMAEQDYINYLADDSTLSSPLIPLDVISENGISKKLNFRQLNDALNSGRIQLFPNGPRTPTTDRKGNQRFWHGLEQQPMEEEVPDKVMIKPRGTLNFNESMMMSPAVPQKSETKADHAEQHVNAKTSLNAKRNYRFSQADELMLDNTNFLVNAKMGDETHSRNNSKCSSRRETTYDNTAMELDDLEKHEAAVAAALEGAKLKQTMHEPMEQDHFLSPCKNVKNNLTTPAVAQQSNQTHLSSQEAVVAQHRTKSRPTLLMAEPIEEDEAKPNSESSASKTKFNVRRQTLHLAEAMDEDLEMPKLELQSNAINNRQQTLHMADFMDEDSFCSKKEIDAASMKPNSKKQRQTLHMSEPIDEESVRPQKESQAMPVVDKDSSRRRQSIHLPEPIEEDSFCVPTSAPREVHQNKNRHTMHMSEQIETDYVQSRITASAEIVHQYTRHRQTLVLSESIEEVAVQPQREEPLKPKSNAGAPEGTRRRQTMHLSDPIEEDSFCSTSTSAEQHRETLQRNKKDDVKPQEVKSKSAPAEADSQYNRRRQTLHLADPIEDDSMCSTSAATKQSKETNRRRQTLHHTDDIEEDPFCSTSTAGKQHNIDGGNRRRQTLLQEDPIEEDPICSRLQTEKSVHAAKLNLQYNRRRQTLHVDDPIEEDSFSLKSTSAHQHKHNLQRDATMKEEKLKHEVTVKQQSAANLQCVQRRQTLHLAEPIEEDSICSISGAPKQQWEECNRRRQTVHHADPIEEDQFDSTVPAANQHRHQLRGVEIVEQADKEATSAASLVDRRRKTITQADPIAEDSFNLTSLSENLHKQNLQRDAPIEEGILESKNEMKQTVSLKCNNRRQTTHVANPIEEDSFNLAPPSDNLHKHNLQRDVPSKQNAPEYNTRRQTTHLADPIEEDSFNLAPSENLHKHNLQGDAPSKQNAPKVDLKYSNRRQTTHLADPIEEDSFCSTSNAVYQQQGNAGIEKDILKMEKEVKQSHRPRQTLHVVDPMEEDSFCSKSTVGSKGNHFSKYRATMLTTEAIDVDQNLSPTHTVAPAKKESIRHRQTLLMTESILEEDKANANNDSNCKQLPSETLNLSEALDEVKSSKEAAQSQRLASKPRQTQYQEEAMDVEMSNMECTEQRASRPKPKLREAVLRNDLLRKTLDKENVFISSSFETPEMKKKRQMFALTPGRSMIEFEDLEEDCKIKTPAGKTACRSIYQAMDMELDMDTSNYATPEKKTSFNVKRLPIHLTPNLPEPKKRNLQLHLDMEEENISQPELETSEQQVEELEYPTNRSRIPVLCKSLNSPWRETEQLDGTVQMVRAQMIRQTGSHGMAIPHFMEHKMNKDATVYEDNPITISDVSNHFKSQRELAKNLAEQRQQPKETSIESRNSNELSNKSYATAHKKFINLSGDTIIFNNMDDLSDKSDNCEIDKTRLSLVSTLLDEADDEQIRAANSSHIDLVNNETCLGQLDPPVVAGAEDACKKCKHCRRSMDRTRTRRSAEETFELPVWPDLGVQLERLKRLRQKPRISDVHKYWELKKLENNSDDDEHEETETECDSRNTSRLSLLQMQEMFNSKWEEYAQSLPQPKPAETFAKCLKTALHAELPNWIFDSNLQIYRTYIFSHRKITTFKIYMCYEPLDLLETKIRVGNIQLESKYAPPSPLKTAFAELLDFQLKLNLPLNLDRLLDGNDVADLVKFLKHIDGVCLQTTNICRKLLLTIITANARLISDSNRIIVRKTVRRSVKKEDEAYARTERIHFNIQIGNVQEISFEDILQPPLHQFDEKIRFLPRGIEFLKAFLHSPEQYLKHNVDYNK
ncbi:uncharacterized protein LOC6583001 isoform X1 [Drosophila mojavensis]|uniref:Uncharacterized protein n=1 Tax=Drosophila mojavensis TaxID=7230 RepID=B4L0I9_DROMO|nr:uncharacterized protein LOC6583001 isoform X1 [Drosophila mojavensis]EDW19158.2 uncharacterized protein Dmoj_GI13631 [Drosophila mojavensis]